MAASALFSISIVFFFLLPILPNSINAAGFSVELIHRDSPKSPFYNSSQSLFDRVSEAIRGSNSRVDHIISSTSAATGKDVSSTVVPNSGSYLMRISLGTPPLEILAIADTGSDLIWTQCIPCKSCYKQVAPLFSPSKSSTYRRISCSSKTCSKLPNSACNRHGGCKYENSYGFWSYTNGVLAKETLTMASSGSGSVSFRNITFGCGHRNEGGFDSHGAGMVGLGRGPLSLVSQLGPSVGRKFAYCLVPRDHNMSSSPMDFGDRAIVSGNGTVFTPLISKPGSKEAFYYVTLEKISVGEKSVFLPSLEKGNIIIDTGTTVTYLPTSTYQNLLSVLKGAIDLTPVMAPTFSFELCYEFGKDIKVPDMTFAFDGAEVVLNSLNTFIKVNENVTCAAFIGTGSDSDSDSFAIIGNVALQNFRIGYDLDNMKVALKPMDCAHQ